MLCRGGGGSPALPLYTQLYGNARGLDPSSGHKKLHGDSKMLNKGSMALSIWCVINFILAFIILCYVIVLKQDSPILQVASFSEAEIASLNAKVISSLNALTILYNSCSMALSVLTWSLIRKNLVAGQKWAFWKLVFVIGFVEVMAFVASAPIGNARWQVNVLQSVLYLVGIGLSGYALFKRQTHLIKQPGVVT
jgi:hypothetical protein